MNLLQTLKKYIMTPIHTETDLKHIKDHGTQDRSIHTVAKIIAKELKDLTEQKKQ